MATPHQQISSRYPDGEFYVLTHRSYTEEELNRFEYVRSMDIPLVPGLNEIEPEKSWLGYMVVERKKLGEMYEKTVMGPCTRLSRVTIPSNVKSYFWNYTVKDGGWVPEDGLFWVSSVVVEETMTIEQYIERYPERLQELIDCDGNFLRFQHRQTEEMCIKACQQPDACAIKYVKDQTPRVQLAAVKANKNNFRHIHWPCDQVLELVLGKKITNMVDDFYSIRDDLLINTRIQNMIDRITYDY